MELRVDRDECMSAGKCVADFASAFDFDDDELVVLLPGAHDLRDEDKLKAARRCPSRAIRVVDDTGADIDV